MEFETYLHLVVNGLEERARIDLLLRYADEENETKVAIKLKFLKGENQREPNNRYDVFEDLTYLEYYKQHGVDFCYFILATDHVHYVKSGRIFGANERF